MTTKGYIKLHRKILDNGIFENAELLKVFVWCILKANSEPAIVFGRQVKQGQFITGRVSAAEELRLAPSTVYDRLQRLKKLKYIKIDSNKKNTLITVIKYKTYQGFESKKRDLLIVTNKFVNEVMLFSSDYSDNLLQNFIAYWTEPNRSKTKLKFELQETFSISRRLKRWQTNQSKYNTQTKLTYLILGKKLEIL